MKKIYFTVCMFAMALLANAQQVPTFAWNRGIGSTGYDNLNDFVVDNSNNIISGGYFGATVNFDTSATRTASGIYDMFITKHDANGNLLWVNALGGPGQDYVTAVEVDANRNVYVLGDFYDSIDYNPGAVGQHTFVGQNGLSDMILIKYDASGVFQWAKQIGGNSIDKSSDMTIDSNGNLIITGYFYHTADFNPDPSVYDTIVSAGQGDIFIAKYDNNGNFIFVKQLVGPGFQNANSITVDNNNNIIISGAYSDTPDFNPGVGIDSIPVTTQYGNVLFFAKYDSNGNYIWAKGIQSNGYKSLTDLKTDSNGDFYITGNFTDVTDFDPDTSVYNITAPQGNRFIFFAKYNHNGNLVWAKYINHPNLGGQDLGTCIAIDALQNLYLTGQFWGQGCIFDPSATPNPTSILGSNASNNYDIFIAKYSINGDYIWAYNIGDAGSDKGVKIVFDSENSLIFGTLIGSSSFGGQAGPSDYDIGAGTALYASLGSDDFTITKYTQCYINPSVGLVGNTLSAFANNANYQWVNCNVGFLPVSNATAQSFTPTASGSYACIVSNTGCSDTTSCIAIDLCVGVINTVDVNAQTMQLTCSLAGATYQWLNCTVGNIAIAGATSQTFLPTANGSYACKITKNGCIDTSACVSVDKVGIQENSFNTVVNIFPNPAKDFVVVKLDNSKNITLVIFDANGKTIYTNTEANNNQFLINTQNIAKGLYTLKLTDSISGNLVVKRFIKE